MFVEPRARQIRILLTTFIMLTLAVGVISTAVQAAGVSLQAANLSVSPSSGPPGAGVTVSGSGWTSSNSPYRIFWDQPGGIDLGSFNPSGGSWSTGVSIPGNASAGNHTIVACEGFGTEFQQCASTAFTVISPATNTPAPPTATFTPVTPSLTPTNTPTPTATLSECIDELEILSPESGADLGGVESVDLEFAVTYGRDEPPEVFIHINNRTFHHTKWPDPSPGTSVTMERDPENPYRYIYTAHDLSIDRGHVEFMIRVPTSCLFEKREYQTLRNADAYTPTPLTSTCGGLGFGEDAEVIRFSDLSTERFLEETREEYGVLFNGSVETYDPEGISERSRFRAGASTSSVEFGSILRPIQMRFTRPLSAVGTFVGLEKSTYVDSEITASMQVYGLRGGEGETVLLGTSTTSFPPEPTDVVHCLKFEAAEGDLITSALIEYTDAEGTSLAERRIIDDLTLVYSDEERAADQPPVVAVTFPEEDSTIERGDLTARALIEEDIELSNVWYRLNEGDWQEITASPDPSNPTQYLAAAAIDERQLFYDAENTVAFRAEDSSEQQHSDRTTFRFEPEEPFAFTDLRTAFTQTGVFDLNRFPANLVAEKTGSLRVSGVAQFGGSLHPVSVEQAQLTVRGPSGTNTYQGHHKVGNGFEPGGPFSGAMEIYFFIPGEDLTAGSYSMEFALYSDGEPLYTQPLASGLTFTAVPAQYQFHVPVEDPFTGENAAGFYVQMHNMSRLYPVRDGTAPFGSPVADASEAGIIYIVPPTVIDLPNGTNPETGDADFAWDFIYDGSGNRSRLVEGSDNLVDCNGDGAIDSSDPSLKFLQGDGAGGFMTGTSDPPGHVQWDWNKPEDVDGDGSVSQNEIALWVVQFYDLDGDDEWHDYQGAARDQFTPGDPYLTFKDRNGNCRQDDGERSSIAPAALRKTNAWSYMRSEAERLMDEFAAANGLERMATSAVLADARTTSLNVVGNCGLGDVCWDTTRIDSMVIAHELGHGWGLSHETPVRFTGGALNLNELVWIPEGETRNFMFPNVGDEARANFASSSRFGQLFRRGAGGWNYFGGGSGSSAFSAPGLALIRSAQQGPQTSQATFGLYGTLSLEGDLVIHETRVYEGNISGNEPTGPYSLRFLSEAGELLAETAFDVTRRSVCDGCTLGEEMVEFERPYISVRAAIPAGTEQVEITAEGQIIDSLEVSLRAPSVEWVAPGSGIIRRGTTTGLRWNASDGDDDALTFSLAYSPNGGETFIPFAAGLTDNSYDWQPAYVPGSDQAVIRVTANDGFHSVSADSPAIRVEEGRPSANILSPRPDQAYGHRSSIVLSVEAVDPEDGPLSGESVVWTDQEGVELGRGARLILDGHEVGEHTLTVNVSDSAGNAATDSTSFEVAQSPERTEALVLDTIELTPSETTLSNGSCFPAAATITASLPQDVEASSATLLLDAAGLPQEPVPMEAKARGESYTAELNLAEGDPHGIWQVAVLVEAEGGQFWSNPVNLEVTDCPDGVTGNAEGQDGLFDSSSPVRTGILVLITIGALGFVFIVGYTLLRKRGILG